MDIYYARSENDLGEKETIQHHLARAGELCREFLEPLGYGGWGTQMGQLHDLGKWSEDFQQVLSGKKVHVNHAIPGAAVAYKCPEMAAVIASHHGGLQSYGVYRGILRQTLAGAGERLDQNNYSIPVFGREEYRQVLSQWGKFFHTDKLEPPPDFREAEDPNLDRMLFQRFLFSALIDADWSSSAEHFDPAYLQKYSSPPLNAPAALDRLLAIRREKQRSSKASPQLNRLRDSLFDCCLESGKFPPGLFTLTAPTGLGKTLGLMAFALQHCITHGKRRVILVLPYLSILEQNCRDYRAVIPELMEIHSNISWSKETAALMERWDAPCIATTNVSFLEPLFSADAGRCRHLHQLANSVIILDEAQTLPAELLDATLRSVKALCSRYGCTVVFSTATQPSFRFRPGLSWQPREIVPDPAALFEATRRTTWQWRTNCQTPLEDIGKEMLQVSQCCVIVNLKKHVRSLMDVLFSLGDQDSVFCLTTDLCPAHRDAVLKEVRSRLAAGLPCHLVATQCVEAGVDLDFPVVYRALAPLDSLIQAAGRCNRNGSSPNGKFIVFLPEESGRSYPSSTYEDGADKVKILQSRHSIDPANLHHIAEYYELVYSHAKAGKQGLRKAVESEDFPEVERQYRLIPKGTVQVIVPYEGEMALYREIREKLDTQGLTTDLLRKAKVLTVSTYDRESAENLCQRLYFFSHGGRESVPTEYYLLCIPENYDSRSGLNFSHSFTGIL